MNLQQHESSVARSDNLLDVVKIWATMQGEGPFAGRPAIFIRLAGCNLQCPLCDTDYTQGRHLMDISDIVRSVTKAEPSNWSNVPSSLIPLVVITGGEPLRQEGTVTLIHRLLRADYRVQIETNGTYFLSRTMFWRQTHKYLNHKYLNIVISPKTPTIHPDWKAPQQWPAAFKYVVGADEQSTELYGLPQSALGNQFHRRLYNVTADWPEFPRERIWLQPLDTDDEVENERHLQHCAYLCQKYGYNLSIQLHKILGVE